MPNTNYILTSDGNIISEDELYHWGIKGMKWGVRRYQNKDGSLTNAGKRKYSKEVYKNIQSGSKEGKSWYDISDDLSKDVMFKSAVASMHDLRKAHRDFKKLSTKRNEMYENQSKKISKKEMNRLIDEEINNNRQFYQDWKPRFFNKDGSPTSELRSYVEDAIASERAYKNNQFKEIDDAYNKAWKKYDSLRTKAVNDLVGRHSRDYVYTYSMYGNKSVSVRQIVEQAISNADWQMDFNTD